MAGTYVSGPPTCEHRRDALGLGTGTPRLSWRLRSDDPGFVPDAYEIAIDRHGATETVRGEGPEQVLVNWPFAPLRSRERATVRVRVRGGQAWTPWSDPADIEVGLLTPDDWTARFVSPRAGAPERPGAPVLCRLARLDPDIASARLYITAQGLFCASIDGRPVTDDLLTPGWTSYHHRLRHHTYAVTDLVHPGDNHLAVVLGNGWWRGRLGFGGARALYGDRLALLAQLEVTGADGRVQRVVTDERWTAHEGNVVTDDLYDGQWTDLRRPRAGGTPRPVDVVEFDLRRLVAPTGPPVRATAVLPVGEVVHAAGDRTLVDFGQNLVGWVRLRLRDTATGGEVTVRHAEVLEDGELCRRPLRTAAATDRYTLAGAAEEVLEPAFTFHGFRYAEIVVPPGAGRLDEGAVEAVVVGSDLERTGWFTCDDADLTRLHDNVVWSMRGNFVDVPTDCPQRDERLGWTGDLQVFAPTAAYLYDCAGLLASWLADLAAEQAPDGSLPLVVPDVLGFTAAVAGWGDAAAVVPWVLYERTGDRGLLADAYPCMARWVERAAAAAGPDGTWAGGFQLGDWLDPSAPPDAPWAAQADPGVVATAHLARSADLAARAATVLGRDEDATRFAGLADRSRLAFASAYVTPAGRVTSDCPTVYALALVWDLLPGRAQRDFAGRRLADLVRGAGFGTCTGFLGTPVVADALCRAGRHDLALRLLAERRCPSWLYPVTMGATTVWERWDSLLPDGSVNPGQMTSFNHYALGAVADWLHRTVAGLAPAAPGYREVVVRPLIGRSGPRAASTRHRSPYGDIAVAWEHGGGRVRLTVEVPVGVTATVHVPGAAAPEVRRHGRHRWDRRFVPDGAPGPAPGAAPTLRDALDDDGVLDRVLDLLVSRGVGHDRRAAAGQLVDHLDTPPDALPVPLSPASLMAGELDVSRQIAALAAATEPTRG